MKTYCVKCKKDTKNIDPKIIRTKNNRLVMQSKCSICRIKKSRFVKEQEAKGSFSNLGIKTPLKSDSHLLKKCFFCFNGSSSKKMKNAFYFILKALLVLKIFKFLS